MSSKKSFLAALCLLAMPGVSPAEPVGPKPVPVSATAAKRDFYAAKAQEGYAEVAALKIPPATKSQVSAGRELFLQDCAACHGEAARGDGPAGAALDPKPNDLTKVRTYKYGRLESAIFRSVKYGTRGTGMAPWDGRIEDKEIWKLVAYVRAIQFR